MNFDNLGIDGFTYADLHEPARLAELTARFFQHVAGEEPELAAEWARYAGGEPLGSVDESKLIVRMAPHVGDFVARLFSIEHEAAAERRATTRYAVIFEFKKRFVKLRVHKKYGPDNPPALMPDEAAERVADAIATMLEAPEDDRELAVATVGLELLAREQALRAADDSADGLAAVERALAGIEAYCYYAARAPHGDHGYEQWASLRVAHALDYQNLVQIERPFEDIPEIAAAPEGHRRRRDGFGLTDPRMPLKLAMEEVDYCLYCHERDKDSCSKGIHEKDGAVRRNSLGIRLAGCPLDERISEMHILKRDGHTIGALAVVMIDNPMCPGTGHRICNDCMKACIFQKQEPVNIPQIETRVLTDVLGLPYGFEIYGLLTRWNPLNVRRPHALPYNGRNVLVVGLGPAGYTLAHYLCNEGFGVVGIDGLKIEPFDAALTGGPGRLPRPIRDIGEISGDLDARVLAGFGGVSEYGITVRWDKNFLTIVHLTLARRRTMRVYGGVRFGGTIEADDAWALGFDHIAIASGAGRPTIIRLKNNLIRGIRKASDFLMALQLTGAFKRDSMANLQVRLPAIVIGGGLTAIDTATELLAYYVVQCEKYARRVEALAAAAGGVEPLLAGYDPEERKIAEEFLAHADAIRSERERAASAGETPDFAPLVRAWGGVTIAYRKRLQDAPAYRLNHEEVAKALEEGIYFAERLEPREAIADEHGALAALVFERAAESIDGGWGTTGETVRLAARSLMVAAGTHPNAVYEKEHPGTFERDEWGEYFVTYAASKGDDGRIALEPDPLGVFTSYESDGRLVSVYGDNHRAYAGNVVKAMASAQKGYRQVVAVFADEIARLDPAAQPARDEALAGLFDRLDDLLLAHVVRVDRLTPTIVDVIVRAPLAARKFHPGQFYRLQNFERESPLVEGTRLTMEGIALTGAWVDPDAGLLSLIVLEMGGSSRLCAGLREGEPVVVMGPTGSPTEIPTGETVLLAGGGLGNAVLFSIAKAMRDNGNHVLYFAGYKNPGDVFKRDEIEEATDQVIWASDVGPELEPRRPQDLAFVGNIVECMRAYASGDLGPQPFDLRNVDRIIAIGSDRMMAAVEAARHGVLAPYLRKGHVAIGSINSSMQCMMKEICAQCLQKHVDPVTGAESVVFSCFNQDQRLDQVDFANLNARLKTNSLQEKMTNLWLSYLLDAGRLATSE